MFYGVRGKYIIRFRIFLVFYDIFGYFNLICELILFQLILDQVTVYINLLYLGKEERLIEKNNMAYMNVYIMLVRCICILEYYIFIYILEIVLFLKLFQC